MATTECNPIVIDSDDEDLDVIVVKEEKVVSSDDEDAVIFISETPGTKQLKEDSPAESVSEKTSESDTLSSMSSAVDIGVSRSLSLTSDFSYNLSLQIGSDDMNNLVASSGDGAGPMLLPVQEASLFGETSAPMNNADCTNNQDLSTKNYDLKPLLNLPCAAHESNCSGRKNDEIPTAFQTYSNKSVILKPSSFKSGVVADSMTASSSGVGRNPDENFWSYLEGVKEKCKASSFKVSDEQNKPETSKHVSQQSYCHPKKKLKYSDEFKELFNPSLACINCSKTVLDKNVSRCSQTHATCTDCLNDMVLLILTRRSQEKLCMDGERSGMWIKSGQEWMESGQTCGLRAVRHVDGEWSEILTCPKDDCNGYFSSVEMKRCLPPVVVQVFEEYQEQDYARFFDKMMQQEGDPIGEEEGGLNKVGSDLPKDWYPMDPTDSFMLVRLQPETPEHLQVTLNFYGTRIYPCVDIINIYRVQNPILWKYYCVKKDEMVRENDGHIVPEKDLFHGTPLPSIVEAICRKGFDWRLCGKHGTAFGEGCYFAVKASYSHRYTGPTNTGPTNTSGLRSSLMYLQSQLKLSTRAHSSLMNMTSFASFVRGNSIGNPPSALSGLPMPTLHLQSTLPGVNFHTNFQVNPLNLSTNVDSQVPAAEQSREPDGDSSQIKIITPAMFKNGQDPFMPGSRRMFQARILVGRFTGGHSSLRKPPPLHPQLEPFGSCYDTCVDDIYAPNIYVVFDSAQTYPDYVIEYQFQS